VGRERRGRRRGMLFLSPFRLLWLFSLLLSFLLFVLLGSCLTVCLIASLVRCWSQNLFCVCLSVLMLSTPWLALKALTVVVLPAASSRPCPCPSRADAQSAC
jgi:hypothetical protein